MDVSYTGRKLVRRLIIIIYILTIAGLCVCGGLVQRADEEDVGMIPTSQ